MAGMLQFASDWYHRLASSGYVPRSFFKPDPPNLADLPRRRGRLTLEIRRNYSIRQGFKP